MHTNNNTLFCVIGGQVFESIGSHPDALRRAMIFCSCFVAEIRGDQVVVLKDRHGHFARFDSLSEFFDYVDDYFLISLPGLLLDRTIRDILKQPEFKGKTVRDVSELPLVAMHSVRAVMRRLYETNYEPFHKKETK